MAYIYFGTTKKIDVLVTINETKLSIDQKVANAHNIMRLIPSMRCTTKARSSIALLILDCRYESHSFESIIDPILIIYDAYPSDEKVIPPDDYKRNVAIIITTITKGDIILILKMILYMKRTSMFMINGGIYYTVNGDVCSCIELIIKKMLIFTNIKRINKFIELIDDKISTLIRCE